MTIFSSELVSGIVSTALSRGSVRIRTDNLTLMLPVVITIHHSDSIEVSVYTGKIAKRKHPFLFNAIKEITIVASMIIIQEK